MNRLAIVCALAVVLLTMAALAHHSNTASTEGDEAARLEPERTPAVVAPSVAAASATAPEVRTTPVRPRLAMAALRRRIDREVLEPLSAAALDRSMFSRIALPPRSFSLRMEEEEIPAPDDEGRVFVRFDILAKGGRGGQSVEPRLLVHGRIDAFTGRLELAARTEGEVPEAAWGPAATVLSLPDRTK